MTNGYLKLRPILIFFFLLPGFFISLYRIWLRHNIERSDKLVEIAVDFEEIRKLAREEVWNLDDLMKAIASSGVSTVGISEDTLESLVEEGRVLVFDYQEFQKYRLTLSVASFVELPLPPPGALWIQSHDIALIDRIEQHLLIKIGKKRLKRLTDNLLQVNKSGVDFFKRIGLGFSFEYIQLAKKNNLGVILRLSNYPGLSAKNIKRIISWLPPPESVSGLIFADEEVLGARGNLLGTIDALTQRPFRIGHIELLEQNGMRFLLKALRSKVEFVQVHGIGRKEMDEIYNVRRAQARFVRAVCDRSVKLLYLRCFFQDSKRIIKDLVRFNLAFFSGLVRHLENKGFKIAKTDDERKTNVRKFMPQLRKIEYILIALTLCLGIPTLLILTVNWNVSKIFWTSIALLCTSILCLPKTWGTVLAGIIGGISFPTIGIIWAISNLEEKKEKKYFDFKIVDLIGFLFRVCAPSLLGGILVAALHSESDYLLRFNQFRGVKVAFIIPILWTSLWGLKKYGFSLLEYLSKPLSVRDIIVGTVVVLGIMLYILRSGNVAFLKPSEWEDMFRTYLENVLVARPRNKEFLIGYPAIFFFLLFRWRNLLELLPFLILFIQMGQVSVFNSFCHFHTPIAMTFIRCFNGLWLGILVGIVTVVLFVFAYLITLVLRKQNVGFLLGYFGFGNFGDELLWRVFVEHAKKNEPTFIWKILYKENINAKFPDGVQPIFRNSVASLIEQLASSKALIVPGGGVIQAVTSYKSLLYYISFIFIGKMLGNKILLPAQGFGPWQKITDNSNVLTSLMSKMSLFVTRLTLESASYISVRDSKSLSFAEMLPEPKLQIVISADLAFLAMNSLPQKSMTYCSDNCPVIGAVLRGKSEMMSKIASVLCDWEKNNSDKIIPIALQQSEDVYVWENVKKQIVNVSLDNGLHEAVAVFYKLDVLVSSRLHACVIASVLGIPWIGIVYDPKIQGLATELSWPYFVQPDEFSVESFNSILTEICRDYARLSEMLLSKSKEKAALAAKDIETCFSFLRT